MEEGFAFPAQESKGRAVSIRLLALSVGGALLLGAIGAYLFVRSGDLGLGEIFRIRSETVELVTEAEGDAPSDVISSDPEVAPQAAVKEAIEAVERVELAVEQAGGIDQRVAAMEQRLTRLDLQSQAAAGNAARAEALFIAIAARRTIERGAPLGYMEDQLVLRFGEARPNAVQTVIAYANDPVTLEQLIAQLEGIAPELSNNPADGDFLTVIGNELSQLFIVRTDDTLSPVAGRRLERARINLEAGRIEFAINEISNMPNAQIAESWLADAERVAAAQRALEALELAAILEPRDLRNAEGEQVSQPSPASENVGR